MANELSHEEARNELYRNRTAAVPALDRLQGFVLNRDPKSTRGYRYLHNQEQKYMQMAVQCFQDGFELWHRAISAFYDCLVGEHEIQAGPSEDSKHRIASWNIRLKVASVALTSSKMALDATQFGYYSQALMITRHILESWKVIAYLYENPSKSVEWVSFDGLPFQSKVDRKSINTYLANHDRYRERFNAVKTNIAFTQGHAHPSGGALVQTTSGKPAFSQLGANLEPFSCISCIDVATFAGLMVFQELVNQADTKLERFGPPILEIVKLRNEWIDTRDFPPPGLDDQNLVVN